MMTIECLINNYNIAVNKVIKTLKYIVYAELLFKVIFTVHSIVGNQTALVPAPCFMASIYQINLIKSN